MRGRIGVGLGSVDALASPTANPAIFILLEVYDGCLCFRHLCERYPGASNAGLIRSFKAFLDRRSPALIFEPVPIVAPNAMMSSRLGGGVLSKVVPTDPPC